MSRLVRWIPVLAVGVGVALLPVPDGVARSSWNLLAVFLATIVGLVACPLPGGAIVLLGVIASALVGGLKPEQALAGYADPIVWLVLSAFLIARGMIKTGLGRRIALLFIRAIGHRTIGLAYALVGADALLGGVIPSNGARSGGVIFPIARTVAEAYDSRPGPTADRLGAFLMLILYQCDVVVCAIFITGQASNTLIAKTSATVAGIAAPTLDYPLWLLGGIVPGLLSLLVLPPIVMRLMRPSVRHTPEARAWAGRELEEMGRMGRAEWLMLLAFITMAALWLTTGWHGINYAIVALCGVALLIVTGVLTWEDMTSERSAWDVFAWYGGLVGLAVALAGTRLPEQFAALAGSWGAGWSWGVVLLLLLLVYYYSHYAFASITAHSSAMLAPFLGVALVAGAPAGLAVAAFAYGSNLMASVTHYGTTPGPIYFGAGYVGQGRWWRIGGMLSVLHLFLWGTLGALWWKVLGWW